MARRGIWNSPIARMAWVLSGAVCVFAAENIWVGPRLARRSHGRLPSLVPEALSGTWFLVLMAMGVAVILAVMCQALLMKESGLARWKKGLTGVLVLVAVMLTVKWFLATGGRTIVEQVLPRRNHRVVLRWEASATKNVRYNVYRGTMRGLHPDKLNGQPLDELNFTDTTVEGEKTYYYVTRAVDKAGEESSDSNEVEAAIP